MSILCYNPITDDYSYEDLIDYRKYDCQYEKL